MKLLIWYQEENVTGVRGGRSRWGEENEAGIFLHARLVWNVNFL